MADTLLPPTPRPPGLPSVQEAIHGVRDEYGRPVYGDLPGVQLACPLNSSHKPMLYTGTPPDFLIVLPRRYCECKHSEMVASMMVELARTLLRELWMASGLTWDDLKIPYPPGPPDPGSPYAPMPRANRRGRIILNPWFDRRGHG